MIRLKKPSRAASVLVVAMMALIATTICAQQLANNKTDDETTTKLVSEMISRYHISQKRIDDSVSKRLLHRYIEELDPQKLYFLQSDIDVFNRYELNLDDALAVGNVEFAYYAFKVYQERLKTRIKWAHQLVDQEHDFTLDEEMTTDPDVMVWSKSEQESHERWRKRIKNDLIGKLLGETKLEKAKEDLHKRYRLIEKTISQTENHEKLEMYLSALAHCYDPHSSYMSPQTLEDFQIYMRLSLEGIGAALRSEDGYTIVSKIIPKGAADDDGQLKVGDKIIGVGQEEGDIVDIVEMKLNKVVRLIRGKENTIVKLKVETAEGDVKLYSMKRKKVQLQDEEVKGIIINAGERIPGAKGKVGVIHIPSFYRDFDGASRQLPNFKSTARDMKKVLAEFDAQGGVDAVIIDLRFNGGGALIEAVDVSGLFIQEGPVVQVKELTGDAKQHRDEDPNIQCTVPVVVICNKLSASASEIFAGVIKDYQRGIIVGDTTTHGKGTVQNVMYVSQKLFQFLKPKPRGALKLTINQFYRVNGASTQVNGVKSDIVLPSMIDHMDLGEGSLDNALKFDQIAPSRHKAVGMVTPGLIQQLQQQSSQRVSQDPKFKEEQEDINRYLKEKKRKSISLNYQTRLKEKQDRKKGDEEENKLDEEKKEIFPVDYYNDEVLRITLDYLSVLQGNKTVKTQ